MTLRGLARFADRLDLPRPLVTLGEGDTPLVPMERLGADIGLPRLMAKLEFVSPSGSYKDRIAAVSMTHARAAGQRGWVATSSGNAGMALATYGARAGIGGTLFTVASIPREKLLPLLAMGVVVHRVAGVGNGGNKHVETLMFAGVKAAAVRHNLFLGITAHAFNPEGMRGVDTLAYELYEAAPDMRAVYVPTGGGGLATAVARGLRDCGSDTAVVICQPKGCAPIVRYLDGEIASPLIDSCDTTVSGLQLPAPPDGDISAQAVRASSGWGAAPDDDEIAAARRALATREGIFVEPAAATALAAAIIDRRRGLIGANDRIVLVLTGAGTKDLQSIEGSLKIPDPVAPEAVEELAGSVQSATGSFNPSNSQRIET